MDTKSTLPAPSTITGVYVVRVIASLQPVDCYGNDRGDLTDALGKAVEDAIVNEMPYEEPEDTDLVQDVASAAAYTLDELDDEDARMVLDRLAARLGLTVTGCTCHRVPVGAKAGPMLDGHRTIVCAGCAVPIFHGSARGPYAVLCSGCAEGTRQAVRDVVVHRGRYQAATPGTFDRDLAQDQWRGAEDRLTARLRTMGVEDVRATAERFEAGTSFPAGVTR